MWCTAGNISRPSTLFYFTNELPLALNQACESVYADDLTIYTSATTANEVTKTLNKELQSVLEWVASNKLVLNISKTKSIWWSSRSQLNPVMSGVAVEQVEETKWLGVTLDCKQSWLKHIGSKVVKMGRCLSGHKINRCSAFLTPLQEASSAGSSFVYSWG